MGSIIMAANVRFTCPVEGCEYSTNFRMDMGAEELQSEHDARFAILREEHPNHPAK